MCVQLFFFQILTLIIYKRECKKEIYIWLWKPWKIWRKNPWKLYRNHSICAPGRSLLRRATHKRSLEKELATTLQLATTEKKVNHWWSEGIIVKTWMRSRALPVEPTANSLPPSTWDNWMRKNYIRKLWHNIVWIIHHYMDPYKALANLSPVIWYMRDSLTRLMANDKNFLKSFLENYVWAPIIAITIGRRLDCWHLQTR